MGRHGCAAQPQRAGHSPTTHAGGVEVDDFGSQRCGDASALRHWADDLGSVSDLSIIGGVVDWPHDSSPSSANAAIADQDELVLAGQGVCLMMVNEGSSLIDASAWVMDSYEFTHKQSGDIVITAIGIYDPKKGFG